MTRLEACQSLPQKNATALAESTTSLTSTCVEAEPVWGDADSWPQMRTVKQRSTSESSFLSPTLEAPALVSSAPASPAPAFPDTAFPALAPPGGPSLRREWCSRKVWKWAEDTAACQARRNAFPTAHCSSTAHTGCSPPHTEEAPLPFSRPPACASSQPGPQASPAFPATAASRADSRTWPGAPGKRPGLATRRRARESRTRDTWKSQRRARVPPRMVLVVV